MAQVPSDVAAEALHTPATRAQRAELGLRWLEADNVWCGQWVVCDVVRHYGALPPPPPRPDEVQNAVSLGST